MDSERDRPLSLPEAWNDLCRLYVDDDTIFGSLKITDLDAKISSL